MKIDSNNSNIKHIRQVGPTCGLYASVMMINRWRELRGMQEFEGHKLVAEIYEIVTNTENISNIGEIFTQNSVNKLLSILNERYANNQLRYEIVSFSTTKTMCEKLNKAIENGSFVFFPYCKKYQNPHSDGILHWSIIDKTEDKYIIGQQSGKTSRLHINNKKISEICNTPDELFKANSGIRRVFSWDEYFKSDNNIEFHYPFSDKRELGKMIAKRTKERKKILQGKEVKINMIGKMVIIT